METSSLEELAELVDRAVNGAVKGFFLSVCFEFETASLQVVPREVEKVLDDLN